MRTILIAALIGTLGAVALPTTSASAQSWRGDHRDHRRQTAWAQRECQRELRRAHNRRAYQRAQRQCDRLLARAQRDYRYDRARYDRRYYQAPRSGYYWDGRRWRSRW